MSLAGSKLEVLTLTLHQAACSSYSDEAGVRHWHSVTDGGISEMEDNIGLDCIHRCDVYTCIGCVTFNYDFPSKSSLDVQ